MTERGLAARGIDTTTPNVARIYDYLLGGKDNFAADPQEVHAALGEGLAVQLHQRLGPAEPGTFSRGEQHARDRRAHGV